MAKTIVGLFRAMDDAQGAMNDLQNAGLGDNASLAPSREPELHTRLAGAGIPQQDADLYANGVQQGYPLIVVQGVADADAEEAAMILDRHNTMDISQLTQNYQRRSLDRSGVSATTTATSTAGTMSTVGTTNTNYAANTNLYEGQDVVLPIIEEQIRVGKREVERGGVRIVTRVQERPVNEQVTLREETVHVERRAVDRPVDASAFDQVSNQTLEVVEHDEEAVVSKEARVVEEVVVGKEVENRTETIQDTVRRTDVDVEEIQGTTRTSGTVTDVSTSGTTRGSTMGSTEDEGAIERGLSRAGNAVEGATGLDIDRDGDVGRRDPRNNV
jgi:uncharacterized protein (TIGR02271 family)